MVNVMVNVDVEQMKIQFNIKLTELIKTKSDNNCYMSKLKYHEKLAMIKEIKNKSTGKTPADYHRLKQYDVIKIGKDEKLVYPTPVCSTNNINFRHYVSNEEIFDILHKTHLSIEHAGRNRMKLVLERNYKNITIQAIMIYLSLCKSCQKKCKVSKNIKNKLELNTTQQTRNTNNDEMIRCQVDLINMEDESDNGYKFILVYQDIKTKLIQLRPLKTNQPEDVAHLLIDIFCIFGVPRVLQSNHGHEFVNKIIKQIEIMWQECRIAHGSQQYKDLTQEISNILKVWLKTNKTVNWSEGLRFVQLLINGTYLEEIKMSPHEAVFGTPVRVGLRSREQCKHLREIEYAKITNNQTRPENVTIKIEYDNINDNTEMCY